MCEICGGNGFYESSWGKMPCNCGARIKTGTYEKIKVKENSIIKDLKSRKFNEEKSELARGYNAAIDLACRIIESS